MRVRRIKSLKVNCYTFKVRWTSEHNGGGFTYGNPNEQNKIEIGTKGLSEQEILMIVCHELMEICACEMNVRFRRPDCETDYLFVYDHRHHETMANMFAGLLAEFL